MTIHLAWWWVPVVLIVLGIWIASRARDTWLFPDTGTRLLALIPIAAGLAIFAWEFMRWVLR